MSSMASQITSLTVVYSTVYSGADQRKHQSSASLAIVRGVHRGPVNSPHKGPVSSGSFYFIFFSFLLCGRPSFLCCLLFLLGICKWLLPPVFLRWSLRQFAPLYHFWSLFTRRRHQMETFPAFLALCAGNSPSPVNSPHKRPVTRSFDIFLHLRLNNQLSKQSWGWWFETPPHSLWRHCNDLAAPNWIWYFFATSLVTHSIFVIFLGHGGCCLLFVFFLLVCIWFVFWLLFLSSGF